MVRKKSWKDTYPEYNKLLYCDQKGIDAWLDKASSGLMLRVWEEVSKIFL